MKDGLVNTKAKPTKGLKNVGTGDACPMRSDASGDAICAYAICRQPFTPRKRWQRFCRPEHRAAHHAASDDGGLRGVVKLNKLLRGGKRSVTLYFDTDQDGVLDLEPGKVVEVLHRSVRRNPSRITDDNA